MLESNRRVLETLEARIDGDVDESSDIDGRVVVESGAEIRNSRIRGPVIIGSGSVVVDSYIGPYTAIGPDCRIERSDVDQSVVLDRSSIVGVERLSDSLIGRDAEVHRSGVRPAATRLMVGDHSSVDLE